MQRSEGEHCQGGREFVSLSCSFAAGAGCFLVLNPGCTWAWSSGQCPTSPACPVRNSPFALLSDVSKVSLWTETQKAFSASKVKLLSCILPLAEIQKAPWWFIFFSWQISSVQHSPSSVLLLFCVLGCPGAKPWAAVELELKPHAAEVTTNVCSVSPSQTEHFSLCWQLP